MAQATKAYTEQQFIEDVREAFASSKDARRQAQTIADRLRELFATGWPQSSDKLGNENGTYLMHADTERGHPDPGFMVMAYRQGPAKARASQCATGATAASTPTTRSATRSV